MTQPDASEYNPFFGRYISLVPEGDVRPLLIPQIEQFVDMFANVDEKQTEIEHAPYTWTIKQVIGHLTDSERVFGYRALRFARADQTPLPGFDENLYANTNELQNRSLAGLLEEFRLLRLSHAYFFQNLPDTAWVRQGTANDSTLSVKALAFILVGHVRHHGAIVRKRLGLAE